MCPVTALCVCAYVALFARRLVYNHYAIAHTCNAANAHAQGSNLVRLKPKSYSFIEGNRSIDFNLGGSAGFQKQEV